MLNMILLRRLMAIGTLFMSINLRHMKQSTNLIIDNVPVKYLAKANKRIARINLCATEVISTVDTLRKKAANYVSNPEGLLSLQRELTHRLHEYARHKSNIDSSVTADLLKLSNKQAKALANPKVMSIFLHTEAIEPHIVRLPKNKLHVYPLAMERVENNAGHQEMKLTLMAKPEKFYSNVHAQLYDKFLCKYHELANSGRIYSWLYIAKHGLTWIHFVYFTHASIR